jgi:hypothetical protein
MTFLSPEDPARDYFRGDSGGRRSTAKDFSLRLEQTEASVSGLDDRIL